MLPDVRGQSKDSLASLGTGVLREMCAAFSIQCAPSVNHGTIVKRLVKAGVLKETHPRDELLVSYAERRQEAWRLLATGQKEIHEAFEQQWLSMQSDADAVAAAAAAPAAFGADAGGAHASQMTLDLEAALNAIKKLRELRSGNVDDAGAADHSEALVQTALMDAADAISSRTQLMATGALPQSAVEQTEAVLSMFRERYRLTPAGEHGAVSGTDTVASAQRQIWFPAYLACLLDPRWAIPGFSRWWSRRIKAFLEELRTTNFWTFHVYVPDDSGPGQIRRECIQRTICEDKALFFTVQGLHHWRRVAKGETPTHAFYWPGALLPSLIGPHLHNVGIGCRLLRGVGDELSDWATIPYHSTWNK
jgi:hypothetical protein